MRADQLMAVCECGNHLFHHTHKFFEGTHVVCVSCLKVYNVVDGEFYDEMVLTPSRLELTTAQKVTQRQHQHEGCWCRAVRKANTLDMVLA